VKAEDYEAADFKINFSISLLASFKKLKYKNMAEEKTGLILKGYEAGGNEKGSSIDFKEVFKWITSPLLCQELDMPANLSSVFFIHCTFANKNNHGEY
jgi:hypothetical protein